MSLQPIIWAGSGSNPSGNTPNGYYDNDSDFVRDALANAKWAAYKLGYPVQDIELSDLQFYAAFEESVSEYGATVNNFNIKQNMLELIGSPTGSNISGTELRNSNGKIIRIAENYGTDIGVGGNVSYHTGSIQLHAGKQLYDLNEWANQYVSSSIRIKEIFHYRIPAPNRIYGLAGYDQSNAYAADAWLYNGVGGTKFILRPLYEDALRMQAIELNDLMLRKTYGFQLINNTVRIFPIPIEDETLWFTYTIKDEEDLTTYGSKTGVISDHHNVPYQNLQYSNINSVGKHWIKRYFLALCKEMLGIVRSKFPNIPIPNGAVSLDGDSLRTMAETEKEKLKEELKEFLEETTKAKQLEMKAQESENLKKIISGYPSYIYLS
ncbi:MAG TPA: hypothetical protein PLY35_09445 [Thermotogota bacterium]|mgnify:CR=1 FL=1|nr:hypothetical protein [Thermotogota bacterium]